MKLILTLLLTLAATTVRAQNAGKQSDPKVPGTSFSQYRCKTSQTYGAVFYDQDHFAGAKTWVEGQNGECRSLKGSSVASIRVLANPGGDDVFGRAARGWARGVSFEFFDSDNCGGKRTAVLAGNQRDACGASGSCWEDCKLKPKSVRIICNGNGSGNNKPAKVGPQRSAVLFESRGFAGVKHWVEGVAYECRGLAGANGNKTGVDVASVRFVSSPGGDPVANPVSDENSRDMTLSFYAGTDCSGELVVQSRGNSWNTCKGETGNCGITPMSVKFNPEPIRTRVTQCRKGSAGGNSTTGVARAGSVANTVSSVTTFMVAGLLSLLMA
jgi:hypothetical protein